MDNWKDVIELVSYTTTKDSEGFPVVVENKTEPIPVNFKSVTRKEEEHSKIMGYTAEKIVEIIKCNYSNQEELIDLTTHKKYAIKRVYERTSDILELTCSDISREHG